jgi:3-oxoacyl-[acyl-carrier-protein] synthase-3
MRVPTEVSLCGTTMWAPQTVERAADAVEAGRLTQDVWEELDLEAVPVAGPDLSPPDMAIMAARAALKDSATSPENVGLIMHCSVWHQGYDIWSAPHYIADQLTARDALPIAISQHCNAVMPALELAVARLLADDDMESALITAADRFILPGFDRWSANYGCAHGDVGSATVVRRGVYPGTGLLLRSVNSFAVPELEEMHRAGLALTPAPRWGVENIDLRIAKKAYLQKHGIENFAKIATATVGAVIRRTLDEAGVAADDPRLRCITLPRISGKLLNGTYIPTIAKVTSAPPWPLYRRTGHLTCSDILANLADMQAEKLTRPGDFGLVLNAGGGFTWSVIAVEVPGNG